MPRRYRLFQSPYGEDDFEWDPEKSALTFEKRDLAPAAAKIAFRGRLLRRQDTRKNYGEARYQVLGEIYGRIYVIVYTPRAGKCRIVSIRRADADETAIYDQA
ncbi:MAG: BrnT family toxin [Alphaproteobacteria bacterium]|nr:BrnT family toxin [Alphaproteobacteria bacterium]